MVLPVSRERAALAPVPPRVGAVAAQAVNGPVAQTLKVEALIAAQALRVVVQDVLRAAPFVRSVAEDARHEIRGALRRARGQ